MFSIFVLIELLSFVSSNSMIVTWGKPTNYSTVQSFVTSSWDDCVVHCYQLESCVLAHSPVSPVSCAVYTVGKVWEVKKLNSSNGLLVAFKVTGNYQENCPIGDNPPTFGNETVYGTASTSIANYTYEISYELSDQWVFNYTALLSCPVGWTTFARPITFWCIKVFGGPTDHYVYSEVGPLCESQKALLSGLETIEERDFVASQALTLLGAGYPEFGGWWVAGVRKPECSSTGWQSIPYCTGSNMQQFTFTDIHLTNYAGYTWDPNRPDRGDGTQWQNCIQLWIRNQESYPNWDYVNLGNGNADDRTCNSNGTTGISMRGYVCGRLPEVPIGA